MCEDATDSTWHWKGVQQGDPLFHVFLYYKLRPWLANITSSESPWPDCNKSNLPWRCPINMCLPIYSGCTSHEYESGAWSLLVSLIFLQLHFLCVMMHRRTLSVPGPINTLISCLCLKSHCDHRWILRNVGILIFGACVWGAQVLALRTF